MANTTNMPHLRFIGLTNIPPLDRQKNEIKGFIERHGAANILAEVVNLLQDQYDNGQYTVGQYAILAAVLQLYKGLCNLSGCAEDILGVAKSHQ